MRYNNYIKSRAADGDGAEAFAIITDGATPSVPEAYAIHDAIGTATETLSDEDAARCAALYSEWSENSEYAVGDRRRYHDTLYKCLQRHTAQAAQNPESAPSLWAKVLIPDPEVIPEWEQPGSTNPYMIGDKVRHNGKTWVSTVDNNVWEPGVFGWAEV